MGRQLKRVPLDFEWPLTQLWKGYINPFGGPCPEEGKTCFGGSTAAGKWLEALVRLFVLTAEEAANAPHAAVLASRGRTYPHPYLEEWRNAPRTEIPSEVHKKVWKDHPTDTAMRMRAVHMYTIQNPPKLLPLTPELLDLVTGLAGKPLSGMGFDSGAAYHVQQTLLKAAGLDGVKWGVCQVCEGNADDPSQREAADNWEKEEPPTGEGYQLWETTSEGSPTSPVFDTLEKLCAWCENNATTFGSFKTSKEEWMKMLDDDNVHHREGNLVFI